MKLILDDFENYKILKLGLVETNTFVKDVKRIIIRGKNFYVRQRWSTYFWSLYQIVTTFKVLDQDGMSNMWISFYPGLTTQLPDP